MTNEEVESLEKLCLFLVEQRVLFGNDLNLIQKGINSARENTKLKAEIDELKEDISQLNSECAGLDNENKLFKDEIEQLKAELEQSIKLPCKVGNKYTLVFNEYGELFKTTGWELTEITIVEDDVLLDFYCFTTEESEQRNLKSFGKTIFNTQEEAEQSLKGKV